MTKAMIVLYENARLIDASGERFGALCTEGGVIRAAEEAFDFACDVRVNLEGRALMPAFIDLHCHLRDPGYPNKETMETGMRAALRGGYAMLCAMANTNPVCSTPELVRANHQKAEKLRLCRLMQSAAAGENLEDEMSTDYAALSGETGMLSNDGKTIFSDDFMRNLLLASKKYGFLVSTHCRPERKIVARDIELLRQTGGNLHVGHISRAQTAQMIRAAKKEGLRLTCEVTPHHLFGYDDPYRVNPPLRARADAEALVEAVRDGTVDCLSTDHAPHTEADKAAGMAGISNIEHAAQIFMKVFYENDIPLTRLSEMASLNPARRLGRKAGLLAPGYPADLVILEPEGAFTIRRADMISRSANTPFEGRAVRGRVVRTVVEGETRYDHGQAL
ncbi:MAG TPA: dihydroorotase [Clostridia bacterium]|nr:dihydroorotase [Clostridia bacterium]HPK14973.1 dihydroorotase [Clostridia bacterium]